MVSQSRLWFYFTKVGKNCAKCNNCDYIANQGETLSTGSLTHHLKRNHPNLYQEKLNFEKEQKEKLLRMGKSQPKICFSQKKTVVDAELGETSENSQPNSQNSNLQVKKRKIDVTINEILNQWNDDGDKTKKIDSLITEMICVDIQPFSVVGDTGFRRLLNFLAPKYNIKSRIYYSKTLLPSLFENLKAKIRIKLEHAKYLSFTSDAWSSNDLKHSLLSLTVHFIDENFEPAFFVIGASPIKGSHDSNNFSDLISEALNEFQIENSKIHLLVRDAASSMQKTARILGISSFDCFLHKLQLCIKDGLCSGFHNLPKLLESVKKIIRKVRKSTVQRNYFVELQKSLDLPENVLIKNIETRWNSTYLMLNRFLKNKDAISILTHEDFSLPKISLVEWDILESVVDLLKPLYIATQELQSRKATIATVLPIYKVIFRTLFSIFQIIFYFLAILFFYFL